MSEKQFYLLQVNDALFPIGGYSHSQGLETYIQRGIVHDVDTAREYITHKIKWNLAYTELLAARLAYEAAVKKRPAGTSVSGRTSGSFQNSHGTSAKPPEKWVPVLPKLLKKLGHFYQRNRDFQRIFGCKKGKSSQPLLYLRSFLCRNADSAGRSTDALSLRPDICNRHQLRKNNPPQPDIRAAASERMLRGI